MKGDPFGPRLPRMFCGRLRDSNGGEGCCSNLLLAFLSASPTNCALTLLPAMLKCSKFYIRVFLGLKKLPSCA